MYWLTIIEITGVSIISAYIIHDYCNNDISISVKALALLTWVMNFAIIGCVPLDIYITMKNVNQNLNPLDDPAHQNLVKLYYVLYWGLFILCWTLIPLVSEFVSAVDIDPNDRIKRSLSNNFRFYIMIIVLGLGFIVYILLTGTADEIGLNTFLKSLANSYGVALIIGLLGYSLITVPRTHMRTAQFDLQLKYLYFRSATLNQEKKDAKHAFEEEARRFILIKNNKFENSLYETYVQFAMEVIPEKVQQSIQEQNKSSRKNSFLQSISQPLKKQEIPKDIEQMMLMYQNLKRSSDSLSRIKAAIKQHLKQCYQMEDIVKYRLSEERHIEFSFKKQRTGKLANFLNYFEWLWLCHYKPQFKIFISIVLGVMSFLVILHEITLFMDTNFTIFGLPLKFTDNLILIQIFTFIPLLYLAFCVYYGMFRIKISGFYGLYPNHQTDAASLFFTTINFSRVSSPLCLNYLNIIRLKHETAFNSVMGRIDLIPVFGISFSSVFPLLLIVLCLINYFDLYDRLMKFLGMKQFIFNQNFSDRLILEGREWTKQQRQKQQQIWSKQNQYQELNEVVSDDCDNKINQKLLGD